MGRGREGKGRGGGRRREGRGRLFIPFLSPLFFLTLLLSPSPEKPETQVMF